MSRIYWLWTHGRREPHYIPERHYRKTPVPGTGRRGSYCWLRHIRTRDEHRRNRADKTDYGYEPRGKRRSKNLRTPWDDVCRHVERNWKRHRRTQYKT